MIDRLLEVKEKDGQGERDLKRQIERLKEEDTEKKRQKK